MEDGTIVTGLQAHLAKMIEAEDAKGVLAEFKAIMRRGYGKKVGEKFIKNTDVWQEFEGSPAYSELIFELLTNPGELANFINGMVPKDLQQEAARIAQRAEQLGTTPQQVVAQEATAAEQPVPAAPRAHRASGSPRHDRRSPARDRQRFGTEPGHPHPRGDGGHGPQHLAGRDRRRPLQALLERGSHIDGVPAADALGIKRQHDRWAGYLPGKHHLSLRPNYAQVRGYFCSSNEIPTTI
jgi:hypothetical protein